MKILMTGAASPLGRGVLRKLMEAEPAAEFWCGIHRSKIDFSHPRLHIFPLDLENEVSLPPSNQKFDLAMHFAGLAHSFEEKDYWEINHRGTMSLAGALFDAGCRRFVYVSSFRATPGAGAYGESKLAAEEGLAGFDWERLLILRPSEVYGAGGTEGIERFIAMARKFRIVPMIFGHPNIRISPLFFQDFMDWTLRLNAETFSGIRAVNLRGPENLSGVDLAKRISRVHKAIPVPIWWPILASFSWILKRLGLEILTPDQLPRLVSTRPDSEREEAIPIEGLVPFLKNPT